MGQYHLVVNLDRREYLSPHSLQCGAKVWEQLTSSISTPQALFVLLLASNGRGGGDLFSPEPEGERIYGRWAGDRIAVIGDYAEDTDLPDPLLNPAQRIYQACSSGQYRDIAPLILPILVHEIGGTSG